MIISRTPFRISFFGGGTDYPVYFQENPGSVLSTTINKYCYITCRKLPPFFEYKYRIRYSKEEFVDSPTEIVHPSVRNCLKYMKNDTGIEIVHTGDIPAMSGIGSSSAFTVGLLHTLHAFQGNIVSKRQLAREAIHVEQELNEEHVGCQDQVAAAFGGLNRIDFGGNRKFFVQGITLNEEKLERLQENLMFFFTGFARFSSNIAQEQIKETPKHLDELTRMYEMVNHATEILGNSNDSLDDFGRLLHESWLLKRNLTNSITNSAIDTIYEEARRAGALGGKLCGAGGGGFMLLYVPPESQSKVQNALANLLLVPIRFENLGSHIIHYSN